MTRPLAILLALACTFCLASSATPNVPYALVTGADGTRLVTDPPGCDRVSVLNSPPVVFWESDDKVDTTICDDGEAVTITAYLTPRDGPRIHATLVFNDCGVVVGYEVPYGELGSDTAVAERVDLLKGDARDLAECLLAHAGVMK